MKTFRFQLKKLLSTLCILLMFLRLKLPFQRSFGEKLNAASPSLEPCYIDVGQTASEIQSSRPQSLRSLPARHPLTIMSIEYSRPFAKQHKMPPFGTFKQTKCFLFDGVARTEPILTSWSWTCLCRCRQIVIVRHRPRCLKAFSLRMPALLRNQLIRIFFLEVAHSQPSRQPPRT